MGVANGVLHALGSFASGFADAAGDVTDGGFEGFVEDLAERVADDGEEALVVGVLVVRMQGRWMGGVGTLCWSRGPSGAMSGIFGICVCR